MNNKYIGLGTLMGLCLGCWQYDQEHCGNNLGDASCPEGQFCDACNAQNNGCVDQQPAPGCYIMTAGSDGASTSDPGTTTTTPPPPPTTTTPVDDSADTSSGPTDPTLETGEPPCTIDDDCADAAQPFCDPRGQCVACSDLADPNDACAQTDPQNPVCFAGTCVQCTTDQPGACGGATPVCSPDVNQCAPCTEHAHCPQSACHLDGTFVGSCFDPGDVLQISDTNELTTALDLLGEMDQAVFVLDPGAYTTNLGIGAQIELAIINSDPEQQILIIGNLGGVDTIGVYAQALVYLSHVTVSNFLGSSINCSNASLWLDDSEVANSEELGMNLFPDCSTHLRRSTVTSNALGGINSLGGELLIHNSLILLNGSSLFSFIGGLQTNGTVLNVAYSTIVANESTNAARGSLFCVGGESGYIRNSIIASDGDSIDGCNSIDLENNAVDDLLETATNVYVGPVMPSWFLSTEMSNYRLSAAGQGLLADIAQWEEGDPLTDIDGQPIPMVAPSFPGLDQP